MEAGLGDNVDLNGGVTARVVHGTSVNLGDRHFEYRRSDEREDQSDCKRRRKKSSDGSSILRQVPRVTNGGGTGSPMTQKDRPNGRVNWAQLICLELSKCGWGNWPRPSPKLRLGYLSLAGVSCLVVQVKGWMDERMWEVSRRRKRE